MEVYYENEFEFDNDIGIKQITAKEVKEKVNLIKKDLIENIKAWSKASTAIMKISKNKKFKSIVESEKDEDFYGPDIEVFKSYVEHNMSKANGYDSFDNDCNELLHSILSLESTMKRLNNEDDVMRGNLCAIEYLILYVLKNTNNTENIPNKLIKKANVSTADEYVQKRMKDIVIDMKEKDYIPESVKEAEEGIYSEGVHRYICSIGEGALVGNHKFFNTTSKHLSFVDIDKSINYIEAAKKSL